jgi:hypothetical protein
MQRYGPQYNDITLRSQQFGAEVQSAADARIQRSQEVMGQSFQNLGENIQQNVWRNRQMQQEQIRFQQQFDAEQQQFQMGFALQKADADMRLQLHAQEQQLNNYKLQQMAALDAVDMSQIQIDRERMTNQAMKLDIEFKKKQMDEAFGMSQQKKVADIMGKLDPYYITALGYKVDPSSGSLIPFSSEEEKKSMQLALQRRPTRMEDPSMIERRETMNLMSVSREIARLRESLSDINYEWTPAQRLQIEAEIAEMIKIRNRLQDVETSSANRQEDSSAQKSKEAVAPAVPETSAAKTTEPPVSEKPKAAIPAQPVQDNPEDFTKPLVGTPVRYSAKDKDTIVSWARVIGIMDTRSGELPTGEYKELLDADSQQRVAKFIFDNQDSLYNSYKRGAAEGRESKVLDKETYLQNVVNSLGTNRSPYTRNILVVLYKANVITAEQAQAMGLQ